MSDQSSGAAASCVEAIVAFLERQNIEHELVEHDPVMSATAEAHVAHCIADRVAKTIVLHDGSDYVLAGGARVRAPRPTQAARAA